MAGTGYVGLSLAVLLAQHNTVTVDLTATTDGADAYSKADYVIIAAQTNYDPKQNYLRVSYFNELDTYAEVKGLQIASIIKGSG